MRMQSPSTLRALSLAVGCSAGLASTSSAWAETSAAVLEEVLVTARKREESVQDVPVSISAFSGAFMEDSGIEDLQEISAYVPNMYMSKSSQVANQRIIIRGVGSVGNNALEPSVAVFIDGVYIARPAAVVAGLSDIASIEVLRGPQGTLFGRNASVGALNIRTRQPSEEIEFEARAGVGNYGTQRLGFTASGAVMEGVALRLNSHWSDRDGYGENLFDGNDSVGSWEEQSHRLSMRLTPSDDFSAELILDSARVKNGGSIIEVLDSTWEANTLLLGGGAVRPGYGLILAGLTSPDGLQPGPVPEHLDAYDFTINQRHQDEATDRQWGIGLTLSWELAGHTLKSITAYRDWSNDTFEDVVRLPIDALHRVTDYETTSWSQELQLLSNTGSAWDYVLGAYLYHEEYQIDQQFGAGADFCGIAYRNLLVGAGAPVPAALANAAYCATQPQSNAVDTQFEQEVDSWAVFAQGSYQLSDRLTLTAGLRYTDDDKSGRYRTVVNNPALGIQSQVSGAVPGTGGLVPILAANFRANEQANLAFDDRKLTWLASLSYDLSEDVLTYLSASSGYKAGGFNSDSSKFPLDNRRTFDSEEVISYELGIKSTLFDGRVNANMALFMMTLDEFQDRVFDGVSFEVINAGELRQQGVEIDITARPIPQLFASLGVSALDSEFLRYDRASNLPGYTVIGLPNQDLKGGENHNSAEYQASLVMEWSDRSGVVESDYFVRTEYLYIGEQNVGAATDNNPQTIQAGYGLTNLRVGLRAQNADWEVAAWVKNLTEEEYCQNMFYQPLGTDLGLVNPITGGALTRCVAGEPRTYGVDLRYRW